jgi:hypothetical protein
MFICGEFRLATKRIPDTSAIDLMSGIDFRVQLCKLLTASAGNQPKVISTEWNPG